MTAEILLSVIGTLLMILLSALAWALRTLHSDMKDLTKHSLELARELKRELDDVSSKVDSHDATLYGAKGNNGISLDVRNLKEQVAKLPRSR